MAMRIGTGWPAWLGVVLLGCSSDTIGPEGGSSGLESLSEFCSQWAENACSEDVGDACGSDHSECTAAQQDFCETLVGDHYAYSEAANACLAAVGDAYKTAVLDKNGLAVVLTLAPPCDQLWAGDKGPGSSCSEHRDCNTLEGYRCVVKLGETRGQCHVPEEVAAGERCDQPQHVCSAGRYCKDRNCVRRGALGDPCVEDGECDEALHCMTGAGGTGGGGGAGGGGGTGGASAAEGTCEARSTDLCSEHSDCESRICSRDAADSEGECVDKLHLYPKNELCAHLK